MGPPVIDRPRDKRPDFRIPCGSADLDAAWTTTSKDNNVYRSIKIDAPAFGGPANAALMERDKVHLLIWSRSNGPKEDEAANPPAGPAGRARRAVAFERGFDPSRPPAPPPFARHGRGAAGARRDAGYRQAHGCPPPRRRDHRLHHAHRA